MVHFAGYMPRLHRVTSIYDRDGVGADWPLDYADLRPYYRDIETTSVAVKAWPWGDPQRYPH